MTIGQLVREARQRAGMTQGELAGILGVTPSYISDIERGSRGTAIGVGTIQTLARIAAATGDTTIEDALHQVLDDIWREAYEAAKKGGE